MSETIDLQADLGVPGDGVTMKVHDVWNRRDAGTTGNGKFKPPPVGVRDIGFYLLARL